MPVTVRNPRIIPFSMLCPGISQNTQQHQLTLYKGQVWKEKSYPEICGDNLLNIVYTPRSMSTEDIMERNGELYVPQVPGIGFNNDDFTQIPWNSEILQSFAKLTHVTYIAFSYYDPSSNSMDINWLSYEIHVGSFKCNFGTRKEEEFCGCDDEGCFNCRKAHEHQCVPPHSHKSLYMWTKEGFKIKSYCIILIITSICFSSIFRYFEPFSQFPPQASRITNLFRLFDIPCWFMIFLTYLAIVKTFELFEYIAEKMGYCSPTEEEIPFVPFGSVFVFNK